MYNLHIQKSATVIKHFHSSIKILYIHQVRSVSSHFHS